MRQTKASEYAIRCVLYMSQKEAFSVISRKEISREMDIPDQFLGKIAQQLARAGILEILQGAKGGLRLLRRSESINLLEVIESVMGEIYLNECIMTPLSCKRISSCPVHEVWDKACRGLRQTLAEADFYQLSHPAEKAKTDLSGNCRSGCAVVPDDEPVISDPTKKGA